MSASRRRQQAAVVGALWRLSGDAARVRLWVDENCRTGLRCPACDGTKSAERLGTCLLCQGKGAVRPRTHGDPSRRDDGVTVWRSARQYIEVSER